MEYIGIYRPIQQTEKIELAPYQMCPDDEDGTFEDRLLTNLNRKFSGKTNNIGYIAKILRIRSDYGYGEIDHTTSTGMCYYNITFECLMCSLKPGDIVVCKVTSIETNALIIALNGPLYIAAPHSNIDDSVFLKKDEKTIIHKKTKTSINDGSYVKISVVNTRLHSGNISFMVLGKLIDIANKKEIKKYKEEEAVYNGTDVVDDDEFV